MSMREQPCPYRIIDDFGGAFSMGCLGGCILYFIRGMWYSPKSKRFYGGINLLKKRAPVLGGSFGMWGGIFSLVDCSLIHFRQKEDYINPIVAGFVTGGVLAFRAGPRVAYRNAVFGGLMLGIIQLAEVGFIKYQQKQESIMQEQIMQQQMKQQKEQYLQMLRQQRPDMYEQYMRENPNEGPQLSSY